MSLTLGTEVVAARYRACPLWDRLYWKCSIERMQFILILN